MICSQRGSSFANANSYTLDRWRYYKNISGEVTVSQENITDLVGFGKALKINTTTAQAGIPSTSGKQYASIFQAIEAQDLQDLANGASGAKTITLSFWIKSNVTGTFCVSFYKADNTQRLISLPYTINSSNTWEKKTLVVPGDTSGGGIDNDNGNGLSLYWVWARKTGYSGTTSTSWVDYSDAAWANTCTGTIFENVNDHVFITGVQLEVDQTGSGVATDFEHRSFAQELALCQRYYQVVAEGQNSIIGICYTVSSHFYSIIDLLVPMRTTPSMEVSNWTNAFRAYGSSGGVNVSTLALNSETRNNRVFVNQSGNPGVGNLRVYDANSGVYGKLAFIAEL
tara:strand:- start:47 stop:1066 length:1020 start_codon:yes stop_codon:yes gene_type:complete